MGDQCTDGVQPSPMQHPANRAQSSTSTVTHSTAPLPPKATRRKKQNKRAGAYRTLMHAAFGHVGAEATLRAARRADALHRQMLDSKCTADKMHDRL